MFTKTSILKTLVVNLIFGVIATGQYYVLTSALLTYGIGGLLLLIAYGVTLLKNYVILGLDELYASRFDWIAEEKREQPKSAYFGEFHVYMWVATLVESLTALFIVLVLPFAALPATYAEYLISYALFFPIMFLFEVILDFFHYWVHRISHTGILYHYLHKTHHKYRFPTGIITFYQDPFDLVLSNSIPTTVAFWIVMCVLGVPINFFQLSLISVFKTTVEIAGHLGRKLAPASSCPQFVWLPKWLGWELYVEDHDIHHTDFNYNFAKRFGVWDRAFGTYRKPDALKKVPTH